MPSSLAACPHAKLDWWSILPRSSVARPPLTLWARPGLRPSPVTRLGRPAYAARPNSSHGLRLSAVRSTRQAEKSGQQLAESSVLTQLDWRWVKSVQLGTGSYTEKETELLAWLQHNGPSSHSNVQLGLTCLRGDRVDFESTARLHAAVYAALGARLQGLSVHVQRPELCGIAGLLPAPWQAPALESLHLWISPAVDRTGRVQGQLTLSMLEGLPQFTALKELSIWCPSMALGMEELLRRLPPSLSSLSVTHESRGWPMPLHGAATARGPRAPALRPAASPVELLQHRAMLEHMFTLDMPDDSDEEGSPAEWAGATAAPAAMPNLSSLRRLRLAGVDLCSCGRTWQWLRVLGSLEELELANSPLDELPPLPLLRTLRLCDSAPPDSLDALPRVAGALPSLEHLSIATQSVCGHGRNVSLRGLEGSLRSLSVVGAGLYVIPPDLAACSKLTILRLGYTDADSARHANLDLRSLQALESLSVSHALPRGMDGLPHLTSLSLHGVDLSGAASNGLPPSLDSTWQRLAPANLAPVSELAGLIHECELVEDGSCVLLEVPLHPVARVLQATPPPPAPADRLPLLPALRRLALRDCTLGEAFPEGLDGLEELLVHGGEAPPPPLPALPALVRLSLTACKLQRLPVGLALLGQTLRSLDVSGNGGLGAQQAPALPPLPALRRLALSDCGLGELPAGLEACAVLEVLELDSNMGMQGASLPLLPALRRLSLQDCGLFELPAGMTSLPSLQSLDLRGNFCCELTPGEEAWLQERFGGVALDWADET